MALESSQISIIVTLVVCTTLATSIVGLRLVTRFGVLRSPSADDFVLLLALVSLLAFSSFIGVGISQEVVRAQGKVNEVLILQMLWGSILAYQSSLAAAKTSILLQYIRFLNGSRDRTVCWIMIGISATTGIIFDIISIFFCTPISGFWQPTAATHCRSRDTHFFAYSGINIVTDLIIIAFPIPTLLTLRIPVRQKAGVIAIFAIGGVASTVTILRLNSLIAVDHEKESTRQNRFVTIWSVIEITGAIICAALQGSKPLFKMSWNRKNQVKRRWSREPIDEDDVTEIKYPSAPGKTARSIFAPTLTDQRIIGVGSWADVEEVEGLSEKIGKGPKGKCHELCVYDFSPEHEEYCDHAFQRRSGDILCPSVGSGDGGRGSCREHGLPMSTIIDKETQ